MFIFPLPERKSKGQGERGDESAKTGKKKRNIFPRSAAAEAKKRKKREKVQKKPAARMGGKSDCSAGRIEGAGSRIGCPRLFSGRYAARECCAAVISPAGPDRCSAL